MRLILYIQYYQARMNSSRGVIVPGSHRNGLEEADQVSWGTLINCDGMGCGHREQ